MVPKSTPSSAVEAQGVTVAHGDTLALHGATFVAPAGVTAVIGPNGSGKSTLLQAISGLTAPTAGTVRVLGSPPRAGRPDVAHVLQTNQVNDALPLTVLEVVRMGRYPRTGVLGRFRAEDHAAVQEAMERLDIVHLADRQVRDLSGGEQQRAFVAQGLAQQPRVLLLDEPVNGLDAPSQARIEAVIDEERERGTAVLVTTHDLATAAAADHVLLLATHVVASGPPDDVLTEEHLGHAYGGTAFRTADGALVIADPHTHGIQVSGHEHH